MVAITPRRTIVAAALVVALAGAGTGGWALAEHGGDAASAADRTRADRATATVERGDLTDSKVFAGSLGYATPVAVPGAASGTLTWLPEPGQVIHRDEPAYAVDERPVRAFHGAVPLWRTLSFGLRGQDVAQLNANLAALGHDVAQDDRFGPRTLRAVKQWQQHHGYAVTGSITADDVVFVDGDVRVASVDGRLGQPDGGDVLHVTGTDRVVNAVVDQADADRLAVDTSVQVLVNGTGDAIPGTVVDAKPTEGDATGGGSKVAVTIAVDQGDQELPSAAAATARAAGRTEHDVLSVPVSAIIAGSAPGRYSVEVLRKDGTTTRVDVEPGFVADGRVAVTGVSEGDRVVVPR